MIAIISNAGGFITIGYFNNVIPRGCKIHQLIEDATITLLGLSSNKLQLFFSDAILFWPETADFNKSHLLVEEGCSTMLEIQNNASIKFSGKRNAVA